MPTILLNSKQSSLLLCVMVLSIGLRVTAYGQSETDKFLEKLLQSSEQLQPVLAQKETYEIQIIYTQINRDRRNRPHFKTYNYNVDPKRYFYPASTVKLPAVALSLEKLNRLKINGLSRETPVHIASPFAGYPPVDGDSTAEDGKASAGQYSKKILLVSDNDAFNRLYDFLGQEYFNETLRQKNYDDVRILHRLSIALTPEQNRITPAVWFGTETPVYEQSAQEATADYAPAQPILKGKGYTNANDELVNEPFDFTRKNCFALPTQQALLKALLFPEDVPEKQRFDLAPEDYAFLYKYMSMLPRESRFPSYDTAEYWDSYVKFLLFGDSKKPIPDHIRIFNKVGDAYGYLIDNAYIVDFENRVEFLLSAVIHVNKNQIYNDGIYEYDEIGLPFMGNLGRVIYDYELRRKRKNLPDLGRFKQSLIEVKF